MAHESVRDDALVGAMDALATRSRQDRTARACVAVAQFAGKEPGDFTNVRAAPNFYLG